ncbi:MAG: ribosomal protein S18-alanine N-acetyltransferase [Chloroflexota bacterium]|nr:ribosomal protein S18-alanine N-acetyltransferase [Aggregatilineaceae bacterium]
MTPAYTLRPMTTDDIPQVLKIDHASFTTPWSARTYEFEINNRDSSHLVVVEAAGAGAPRTNGWRGLAARLRSSGPTAFEIAGYGGCWLIAGEAHISTIAVAPDYRGRGLGELLLAAMLRRALNLSGEYSVLEVRASNLTAQALYQKYHYQVVGRRRGYYRDDGEDALLMEVRPLNDAYRQELDARLAALRRRLGYVDLFTGADR